MAKGTTGALTKPDNNEESNKSIRVLLIEDNPGDARLIQEMLKDDKHLDFSLEHAGTLKEGLRYIGDPEKPLDAVLLDLGLPDSQGFETFERFQEQAETFTVIILSGSNDVDLALHAVRSGAQDYLVKGQISGDLLLRSIRHAIERDEADRLLRESTERYQELVDRMPDSIIAHRQGLITFVNPATLKLLGAASMDEIVGKDIMDFVEPTYREVVAKRIQQAETKGESQPAMEEKFVRLDGKIIDVEVSATPLSFEKEPAMQVIIRDITERKQREREIEAVAEVSRSLRTAQSVKEILPIVIDTALDSIRAPEGTITLVQPDGDHLIAIGRGARELPVGRVIPKGTGLTSQVVETGVPYFNNHFRTNPDPKTVRLIDLEPTEAIAIVPITAEKQTIGTLGIGSDRPFEDSDLRVLTAICNIGGAAIHRASLYEQTDRRLDHLRSLREIDTAIASSFDLNLTLEIILAQATVQLKTDAAEILLLNEEQVLVHAASKGFKNDEKVKASHVKFGEGIAGRAARERTLIEVNGREKISKTAAHYSDIEDEGFESYYAAPLIAKGKVIGVLATFHRSTIVRDKEWSDFLQTLAGQAAIAINNASLFHDLQHSNTELRQAYDRTIEGWAHALSLRDMETVEHSRRVTEMTVDLARALGISDEQLVHVRRGALLHDIGKMSIPDRVLGKTGPLDADEWVIMRQHPVYAAEMLSAIEFLRPALPIPTNHHEKWDGSGYPRGLKGKDIPLEARIFAIVDVWDALTSDRPYRTAWPVEKVRDHLRGESGKHFDPNVVEAFFHYILK